MMNQIKAIRKGRGKTLNRKNTMPSYLRFPCIAPIVFSRERNAVEAVTRITENASSIIKTL